jgi:integrating conjugative element protein (TIGR03749 family)
VEHRVWDKQPIEIQLPVNQERLVVFDTPVRAELPPGLNASVLRSQIVVDAGAGTIYWLALAAFDKQRVQVHDLNNGNVYLLDLVASPEFKDSTRIAVGVPTAGAAKPEAVPPPSPAQVATVPPAPDYTSLTQMAAQQLYAPARLLALPAGVYPAGVHSSPTGDLFHNIPVTASAIAAWRSGGLYITAVKLVNQSSAELVLDPRTLRGRWLSACFQHNLLKPQGQPRDTTAAYLISQQPFEDSLHGF